MPKQNTTLDTFSDNDSRKTNNWDFLVEKESLVLEEYEFEFWEKLLQFAFLLNPAQRN